MNPFALLFLSHSWTCTFASSIGAVSFEARTVLPPEDFSPFPCVDVFDEELASGFIKIFSQTCTEFGLLALHSEYDANSPSTLNAYV